MKNFLILTFFILLSACGGNPSQIEMTVTDQDGFNGQVKYKYHGILKIYRASSGCMGSGGSYIEHQTK